MTEEQHVSFEWCKRVHDELDKKLDAFSRKVDCVTKTMNSAKRWLIVALALLIVDIIRGMLVLINVLPAQAMGR